MRDVMIWTIDTGLLGASGCDAKDLSKILEAALDHHAETMPSAAADMVMQRYPVDPKDTKAQLALAQRANEAAEQCRQALPNIQVQMRDAITAAQLIADKMGGRVTASVSGHVIPSHFAGIFRRVQVSVDRAAPREES